MKICHKFRPLLCHLNLKGCVRLSSDGLKAIGYCQNLQDLNLSEAQGVNVSQILHYEPQLLSLCMCVYVCVSGGCCPKHWQRLQGSALPEPIILLCH